MFVVCVCLHLLLCVLLLSLLGVPCVALLCLCVVGVVCFALLYLAVGCVALLRCIVICCELI